MSAATAAAAAAVAAPPADHAYFAPHAPIVLTPSAYQRPIRADTINHGCANFTYTVEVDHDGIPDAFQAPNTQVSMSSPVFRSSFNALQAHNTQVGMSSQMIGASFNALPTFTSLPGAREVLVPPPTSPLNSQDVPPVQAHLEAYALQDLEGRLRAEQAFELESLEARLRAGQESLVTMVQNIICSQTLTLKEAMNLEVQESSVMAEERLLIHADNMEQLALDWQARIEDIYARLDYLQTSSVPAHPIAACEAEDHMQTKLALESQARQDLASDMALRMRSFEMELSRNSHNNHTESVEREASLTMRAAEIKETIIMELRPVLQNDVAIQRLDAELNTHQAMFECFTSELASLATKVGSGPINALGLLEASISVQELAQQIRKEKEDRQALEELVSRYISIEEPAFQSEQVVVQDLSKRMKELGDDNAALRDSMRDNVMAILVPVMSEIDVLRNKLLSRVQADDANKSHLEQNDALVVQELAAQIAAGKAEQDILAAQVDADNCQRDALIDEMSQRISGDRLMSSCLKCGDADINSSLNEEIQARCFHDAELERRVQTGLAEVRKWVVQEMSLGGEGLEVKTQLAEIQEKFRAAVLELLAKIQAIENQTSPPSQSNAPPNTVSGSYFGSWAV